MDDGSPDTWMAVIDRTVSVHRSGVRSIEFLVDQRFLLRLTQG